MTRNYRGQEAIEFILITSLVFFGALFTVFIFGNKIAALFGDKSSVIATSNLGSSIITSDKAIKYPPDYIKEVDEEPLIAASKEQIGSHEVYMADNGSAYFSIGKQSVTLSSDIVNLQNTMMQTSGSSGLETIVDEIAYMIETHKDEFNGDVPVEISYGVGNRWSDDAHFKGTAEVNTVSVKVGNHVVVLQNDQTCKYAEGGVAKGACCTTHENATGLYRLEGNINNGQYTAKVTSDSISKVSGNYTADVDTSNGFNLNNATFNAGSIANYSKYQTTFHWDINFDNLQQI